VCAIFSGLEALLLAWTSMDEDARRLLLKLFANWANDHRAFELTGRPLAGTMHRWGGEPKTAIP
jgi:hypothetical protein